MINYTPTPDYYNEYIAHHGILGMHWGVQNGPPYPLDSDKSTGSRIKNEGSIKKKKAFSKHKVKKVKKDYLKGVKTIKLNDGREIQIRNDTSKDDRYRKKNGHGRYQTMTIRTKSGQDDYTIDTKYNTIIQKSKLDKKGNTISKQMMSDNDIASGKELISELKSKQQKQWNRSMKKDFKKLEDLEKKRKKG